jgi:hypothetical protein
MKARPVQAMILGCVLLLACVPVLGEVPPPDGPWRPHLLDRCGPHPQPRGAVQEFFEEARHLFLMQNGGDASVLLEMAIAEQGRYPWLMLMLAQIYILAAQGEPHCLPSSGPVNLSGDWHQDRLRLLKRGEDLLARLSRAWPDDGVVDFLRADAARARDDHAAAATHDHEGRKKCSHIESLNLLIEMRGLLRRPAAVLSLPEPEYPDAALRRRAEGEVLFDLLVDPFGRVAAVHQIGPADPDLVRAAGRAISEGGFKAAQVGYYPVWSWLRVPVLFEIGD